MTWAPPVNLAADMAHRAAKKKDIRRGVAIYPAGGRRGEGVGNISSRAIV